MKYIAGIVALIFAGLAAITLAPKLAFSQALPLPGAFANTYANKDYFGGSPEVRGVAIFRGHLDGSIHYLVDSMIPSQQGGSGQKATQAPACSDVADYIETQQMAGFDTITLTREQAAALSLTNDKAGALPDEVFTVVIINPADGDYKSDIIYLGAYDKNGCYWGQAVWSREDVAKGLAAIGLAKAPMTAKKPAV